MTKCWILIFALMMSSCAIPEKGLLRANVGNNIDPRDSLEKSFDKNASPKFFYFDRVKRLIFSFDKPIAGFTFNQVDMDQIKSENPDLFSIVQCVSGKPCSTSSYESCKIAIPLAENISDIRRNQIVTTLKSRGYPVVQVNFKNDGTDFDKMEVQYFTECRFIKGDINENFPELMTEATSGNSKIKGMAPPAG